MSPRRNDRITKTFPWGLDITKDVVDGMVSLVNPVVLVVWCRRFYLFLFYFIIIIIIIYYSIIRLYDLNISA